MYVQYDKEGNIVASSQFSFPGSAPADFEVVRGVDGKLHKKGEEPDAFPYKKASLQAALLKACQAALNKLVESYPQGEIQSFYRQELEAKAYLETNDVSVAPTLAAIASERSIPLEVLADKVVDKAQAYASLAGSILGKKQYIESLIEAAKTEGDLQEIYIDVF